MLSMRKVKYLILGNGIAGYSAAKEIRQEDSKGSILLIGNEKNLTYYRMRLTEFLGKEFENDELLISKSEWYKENNIEVILEMRAENIETDHSQVKLDNGEIIEYEKLLIALGSRPFIPPIRGNYKKGVFAIRSIEDILEIQKYLEDKESVLVIGGGLLGLEAAWSLKKLGKKVSIVDRNDNLLSRQLDKELSEELEKVFKDEDFILHLGLGTQEILGEDDVVEGVLFDNELKIDVDAVIFSTGVRSDLQIIRETNINCNRGIVVNERMETNIENVYAAGDVVEVDGKTLGLWTAAMEQGKIVGNNMTGGEKEYKIPKLFATTKLGETRLFSAGDRKIADEVYEAKNDERISKIFVKNKKVVASMLYGSLKDMTKLRNATFENRNVQELIKENDWNHKLKKL